MGLADPVLDQRARRAGRLVIRRRLEETPEFQAEEAEQTRSRGRRSACSSATTGPPSLRVFFAAFIATVNTMFAVFALNFATSDDYGIGISNTFMLWLAIVANLVAICVIPFWARLSDRVGRKPVFVTGVARQRRARHRVPRRHRRRQRRR